MKKAIYTLAALLISVPALAEGMESMANPAGGMIALGAAIAVGLAALGGTLGQSKIGAAAMDGLARNPQAKDAMFIPMILGLVFIESLVIFSWVISFMLQGKI